MTEGRVLIIDDSKTVLRVVESVLAKAGYAVLGLDTGVDAVAQAVKWKPDLVLVDFAMPEVNGFEVCKAFGEHEQLATLPIVIMSTRGDPVVDKFIASIGVVDHITKPFAPAALLAVVEHRLFRHSTDVHKRPSAAPLEPPELQLFVAALHELPSLKTISRDVLELEVRSALMQTPVLRALHDLLLAIPGGPAMSGDFALVPIAEVLQLLSLQRQSGFLIARRDRAVVSIAVKGGMVRLVTGENIPRELLLGSIVVRERLMEPKDLEVLLNNRRGTRRLLGAQLVRLGYVSRDDLHRTLRMQSAELVYELIRWGRGSFEFERAEVPPPEVLEFEFDLTIDELLMEGFRRVDEWGLIESAIPSFEHIVHRVPYASEEHLSFEEINVLAAVDGIRAVQEIIDVVGGSTFNVARILYRLVATRVATVRVVG
ncbi:MAG: response regulator [Clostridia bacterium]|nr:response regulator [Deltaproteobacteria bacterium]